MVFLRILPQLLQVDKMINTIEIIVMDHEDICFESVSNYLRYFKRSNSCLILNINVHRFMSNQTDGRLQTTFARDISHLLRLLTESSITLKIRLRRSSSSTDDVIHSLMESFKNEYKNQGFNVGNRLTFEHADYNIVDESSLKSISI
ncbi:hypothetical protein ENBRE01_1122 [Enteropsectra breve]|nr:hypothetical protein ENBRE01_1122 [Enteropsectra breve]